MSVLGPIIIITDLSQFSLRKLDVSRDFISERQFVSVEQVAMEIYLVEMRSWISSAKQWNWRP